MRKTSSEEATEQLASTLAPYLHIGDVVVLGGDLGAGKTRFVQGAAKGLGITADVTSPTFNLVLSYDDGRIPLYHLDLYRLDDKTQLEDIDYFAYIGGDAYGVSFVEWADKFPDELPCDYLYIYLSLDDDGRRTVYARSFGQRARQLLFVWASDSKSCLTKIPGKSF